jgi:SpoVK/Ycf46/Vps4 family AAA+-type ATPase
MHQFRAIYLFDEFDSIGTTRTQGNEVGEIKRVLNTFLLQIEKEDSNSLIIAATNLPEFLDKALFRRFDTIIQFRLPEKHELLRLYKKELGIIKHIKKFNVERIAEESIGLSYGEVHRVCEDIAKDHLIYGVEEISEELVLSYVHQRKSPF